MKYKFILLIIFLTLVGNYGNAQNLYKIENLQIDSTAILNWTVPTPPYKIIDKSGYYYQIGNFKIEKETNIIGGFSSWKEIFYNIEKSDDILVGAPYLENDSNHFTLKVPIDSGYNFFRIKLLKDTGKYGNFVIGAGSITYFSSKKVNYL
jgi:hypothetical protein